MMNKVELCGVNTSKLPLLREDEKEELFRRIQKGDEKAREEYIKGNLRLVLSVIKRFDSSSESADDLFQIGCVGLMKAVDNFDPERLVRFSTYAVPMIVGEIRRYLRDNSSIRVSRSLRDTAYKASAGALLIYSLRTAELPAKRSIPSIWNSDKSYFWCGSGTRFSPL